MTRERFIRRLSSNKKFKKSIDISIFLWYNKVTKEKEIKKMFKPRMYVYYKSGKILKLSMGWFDILVKCPHVVKIVSLSGDLMWEPSMKLPTN